VLDSFFFGYFRDAYEAYIETTDLVKVCQCLGLPVGDPGILKIDRMAK